MGWIRRSRRWWVERRFRGWATGGWLAGRKSAWGTLTVAPAPADPGTLVRRKVKTELGDYRGFYANVRDAINGDGGAGGDGGGWISAWCRLLEMARESSVGGADVAGGVCNLVWRLLRSGTRKAKGQARPAKSLVSVETLIFSPSLMKSGTLDLEAGFELRCLGDAAA